MRTSYRSLLLGLFGAVAILLPPKAAPALEIISAENPDEILNIAKGFGSAILVESSSGKPLIRGRINGIPYLVFFFGCDDRGDSCDDIGFYASWKKSTVSLSDINDWNYKNRFGTASLRENGNPVLDMQVNLQYGVTPENFEDVFVWWAVALRSFNEHLDE